VPPLVDRFAGFEREIERALEGRRYDIGIVEHFWCAPYAEQMAKVCGRTVLDLHNIESVLDQRCAEVESGARAWAHGVFSRAALKLERTWLPRFSEVLTASQIDAERARAIAPGARVTVYPNALPLTPLPARATRTPSCFSGNMEYHPNISAVRFFRREVWPLLRERWPGLVWRLIGKKPGGGEENSLPEMRASRSRGRWTMPSGNWRAPKWRWSRCWRVVARAEDPGGVGGRGARGIHHFGGRGPGRARWRKPAAGG